MSDEDDVLSPAMSRVIPKNCGNSGYQRKIHDATVWRHLQETYIDTVDNTFSNIYEDAKEAWPSYSGFLVSVNVKDDGKRGRSIYAAEPIAEGTKVWKPVHLAQFHSPTELRTFLDELDHDLQCDALLWAYVEKGTSYVALALDPASFVNHGETEDVVNLDENCVALRDIEMGEELLENYSEFIGFDENEVEWFHRIRGVAWKEKGPSRSHSTDEYNMLGAPKMWGGNAQFRDQFPPSHAVIFFVSAVCALLVGKKFLRTSTKKAKCSV
mmetsp:Transcript_14943/g.30979  ORF Transcript_14943/g.30979 Transcript_14943/m.30979 type:complete len:269 (-) Transcript_14943:452-1258(-)|eukprot:CAMPEP_0197265706 /NCGR_PEP_ID=MMETSP1432-20130617/2560_1 /TAXON_ID=44447 /ORGANISM="Pseudo-nitzschia delicatissima, Strain UNC1205" /LENGTH=268 /DNA_ID=CAMNT_0042730477 /DNA_START=90 /DNA_END=896 /DNA_ORIENTATION=+